MKNRFLKFLTSACTLLFAFGVMAVSAFAAGEATQPVPPTTGAGIQFVSPFSFNPLWIWVILCGAAIVIGVIVILIKHSKNRNEAK